MEKNSRFINVNKDRPLNDYCRNVTNIGDDTFVGIKSEFVEEQHKLSIHFPIGYRISETEEDIREDIIKLISVLQEYNDQESILSEISLNPLLKSVRFPVQSFYIVMLEYLNNGYYQIKEEQYHRGTSGSLNMARTIKQEVPIPQLNGFIYPTYRVRRYTETDKDLLTEINRFCVYKSSMRIGWIYKLSLSPRPLQYPDISRYIIYISEMLLKTNRDKDKRLFQAMLDILNFENNIKDPTKFYFGTNNFEYIWERLIQKTFGNASKEEYFPKTKWLLNHGNEKKNTALEPDTVMVHKNDTFILDAKYYKYGVSGNPSHLPNSSSINKQISYGEYAYKHKRRPEGQVYNAFLMPYESEPTMYLQEEIEYYSIGEAVADWKSSERTYERVQGILVDVRSLITNTINPNAKEIKKLSREIITSLQSNEISNG